MSSAATAAVRRFVFLGAPGVGKGTFAGIIAPRLGLRMVTAGDLVRGEIQRGGERGESLRQVVESGGLVPDEVMLPLIADHLPAQADEGYILDGFPRKASQARALEGLLAAKGLPPVQRVLNIELADWVAVAKLLGRHLCAKCGRGFNTAHIVRDGYDMPALPPPASAEACPKGHKDDCPASQGQLLRRSDDTEATVKRRLQVYHQEIASLLAYYEEKGVLRHFSVKKGIKDALALEALMTTT